MNKEIGGCGAGGGGGGGGSWPSSSSSKRTSDTFGCRNWVREIGPPAFLTKTYNIVDDPNTNSIISWGKFGDSFIIWDHLQFSAGILPQYFRHSNLSSFVYQLNNYGFRKIGTDHQWEYENPNFQAGKTHLLTNIKRRGQNPGNNTRRCAKRSLCDSTRPEILSNEMNESKLEIERLKKDQADMEFHVMALEEEMKNVENKTKKLIVCWAKACEIVAQKIGEETGKEKNDDELSRKKTKLDVLENKIESIHDLDHGENNQEKEEMVKEDHTIPSSEHKTDSSTNDNGSQLVVDDHEANFNSEATPEKNSADYTFLKRILLEDDDEVYEGGGGTEVAKKQAKIALDFENLIMELEDRTMNELPVLIYESKL